ncbi:hypothetical protein G9A89_012196 [Geosiphon pyriformis]|nr:hypothetical protein G9A89_012196 [Geosiphon pyriformis]
MTTSHSSNLTTTAITPRSTSSFSEASNNLAASLVPKPTFSSSKQTKRPKVPNIEIFRRLVLLSDGRDKTLKIIQYSAKLYLWAVLSPSSLLAKHRLHTSVSSTIKPRLSALTSHFSTTRKIFRLAHFLEPYTEFRDYVTGANAYPYDVAERLIYYIGFINSIVGMLNDFFDDVYCLGKIGVFNKGVAKKAEPIAIRFWFFNILLDINNCLIKIWLVNAAMRNVKGKGTEEELKKLKGKRYWLIYNLAKFSADLGFCGYDFFGFQFSDGWQAITGLIAGLLSFNKLWIRVAEKS